MQKEAMKTALLHLRELERLGREQIQQQGEELAKQEKHLSRVKELHLKVKELLRQAPRLNARGFDLIPIEVLENSVSSLREYLSQLTARWEKQRDMTDVLESLLRSKEREGE